MSLVLRCSSVALLEGSANPQPREKKPQNSALVVAWEIFLGHMTAGSRTATSSLLVYPRSYCAHAVSVVFRLS